LIWSYAGGVDWPKAMMRAGPVNGANAGSPGHPEGSDDGSRGPGRTAGERWPATFASLCSPSRPPSIGRNHRPSPALPQLCKAPH